MFQLTSRYELMNGKKTDNLKHIGQDKIKAGHIVVLPAYIYVQTTGYQFRISSTFDVKMIRPDGQGYQTKSYDFEKNYSLAPQQSLDFKNRIRVVEMQEKKIAYIEASIQNHMDVNIGFSKLECTGNEKVKFVKILGQDWRELQIPKETTIKLIIQYEVDKNYVSHIIR